MKKLLSLRSLFLIGNVLMLVLFLIAIGKDQVRGWKDYQKEFKALQIDNAKKAVESSSNESEKAVAEALLKEAKRMPIEIRQIWSEEMHAVDRCITCHVGYDPLNNVSLTTPFSEHPYKAPADTASLDIHKAHDLTEFGCVVCHGGQGLATETEAAHGFVKHWGEPLLKGKVIQASCAKCHDNVDELEVHGDIYPAAVLKGRELFVEHGCIGCHQIGGQGGPVSVDLKAETSVKPLSRIDFTYTGLDEKEKTLENWIKLHFIKDPATMVPGDPKAEFNLEPIAPSGMPPYFLPEEEAVALTAYILGLNDYHVPPQYRVERPPKPEPRFTDPIRHGRYVYEKYGCAGCHGQQGRGGIRNYNYQYDVTPNLRRAVSTYTRAELREKLNHGVPIVAKNDPDGPAPPVYMPPWQDKISEDEMRDLVSYLFSIKE